MVPVLNWMLAHWYAWFWLWVFGAFQWGRDLVLNILSGIANIISALTGHNREQEIRQLKAAAKLAKAQAKLANLPASSRTDECIHDDVTRVTSVTDETVGWICRNPDCGVQLPADPADWDVEPQDD
jgi:hypothetical protein